MGPPRRRGHPHRGGLSDYTAGANGGRLYEDSRQTMEDASRPVSVPDAPAGAPPVAPSFDKRVALPAR